MRRLILIALVVFGIIPVAASAAAKPATIKVGLAVTAKQVDGKNYPLYGGEVFFTASLTRPQFYDGRVLPNGSDDKPPVALTFKVRVGDTVKVCPQDSMLGFSRASCKAHTFTRADTAGRTYVFRFQMTWHEHEPRSDVASNS